MMRRIRLRRRAATKPLAKRWRGSFKIAPIVLGTDAGERLIPLNQDAVTILGAMWDRGQKVAKEKKIELKPEHYVFCACENYKFDLTKPMKSWRSAWRSLTKKAGLPGLRFHDLRHSAVTALAESGASDQTIMSLAGHVSRKMLEHYSHIRLDAKRKAVESLQAPDVQPAEPRTEQREIRPN